ncbi:MAG: phosphatase PAP2 family protein [Ferruginibacter sp.]|nr:phosphatase PAP2 family protein [Chitinophagaceae bacterium]MBP6287660.1 phosphatase PAP2 family protein [Ferruginibacter sp.]MBU9937618.1 phosphatase PAP2 family protein [Ferruginibacter sp.]
MNNRATQLLFLFFTLLQLAGSSQNIDIDLLRNINKTETEFKNRYAALNTDQVTLISIAAPAGIALAGFIKKDKKLKLDALYMSAAFLINTGVTQLTKHTVNRKRPFADYPFIKRRVSEDLWLSFPSGHTSTAFCTATSLSLRYRKWYVIVPAYLYATSVGWGRMYQGVHYPSDVLAGALVGAGSAWISYKMQKWIDKKQKKKGSSTSL